MLFKASAGGSQNSEKYCYSINQIAKQKLTLTSESKEIRLSISFQFTIWFMLIQIFLPTALDDLKQQGYELKCAKKSKMLACWSEFKTLYVLFNNEELFF